MAARYQLRHPKSAVPVTTVPRTRLTWSRHGTTPVAPATVRSSATLPYPQIGDAARLWDYVGAEWIEGRIESIQPGYRILVRCRDGLEETVGSYLAFRDGEWVEEIVGASGTPI